MPPEVNGVLGMFFGSKYLLTFDVWKHMHSCLGQKSHVLGVFCGISLLDGSVGRVLDFFLQLVCICRVY